MLLMTHKHENTSTTGRCSADTQEQLDQNLVSRSTLMFL